MRRLQPFRALLVVSSGWLLTLACGSRTGLPPGGVAAAGAENVAGAPSIEPACVTAADCPQPPPGQCGAAACTAGVCSLSTGPVCDDHDPCTVDSCVSGACVFENGRVDADGDGTFASGTSADPKAALGCGNDCDDSSADIHPGAIELCDGIDNDCNGVIDDGTLLQPATSLPTRVSPLDAMRSEGAGLAFDGKGFGASMTSWMGRSVAQFQQLDAVGKLVGGPQRVARVNAEDYGGPLAWTGERYLTAYEDARQDGNYEIYFDLLNRQGQRLIQDLRVTNADGYSLRPSVLWTGAETLLIWDDRRFEGTGDASAIFGQRVSFEGQLLGPNVRLSPPGLRAENASAALSDAGLGMAFVTLEAGGNTSVSFMTTSRSLEQPSTPKRIDFDNADGPVVTALGDEYVVTFHQYDSVVFGPSIYGVVISKGGAVGPAQSLTAGGAHARGNATYSYGDRLVMVWSDDRSGTYQLYAQTFDKKLAPLSKVLRLTTTSSATLGPIVAASADGGLGVLYTDEGKNNPQTFFTRLDCKPSFQLK